MAVHAMMAPRDARRELRRIIRDEGAGTVASERESRGVFLEDIGSSFPEMGY